MKTITTTIAALMLATSAHATDCADARNSAQTLIDDLRASVSNTKDITEADAVQLIRAIQRRSDSVRSSLISVRVYCHGNAGAIKWANGVEDTLDSIDAISKGGPK